MEEIRVSYKYNHQQFYPGLNVKIDQRILEIHPQSPLAGRMAKVCEGTAHEILANFEDQEDMVPVQWNGTVYYVEPVYVLAD
jgi:hypothetical protein